MRGIIACETLYAEIEQLAPDAAVRYLPHDLHEFPLNVPDEREMGTYLADAIASLESAGVSSITVLFAGLDGLPGIRTESVPLVVSLVEDCVSTFRYRDSVGDTGEVKAPGVYYLTRGHIDRAVDGHKLYMAYRDNTDELLARFASAAEDHPDLRTDWAESRLYRDARERGGGMTAEAVDRFFASMFGYYDTVELLDIGLLYDLHRWYGTRFQAFLSDVAHEGHETAEFRITEGDLGLLETLITGGGIPEPSPHIAVFEAGEPVPE